MKKTLLGGPLRCPSHHLGPGVARVVPLLRGVVKRVGVARREGGAPYAWRVRVVEVRQRVSVLVIGFVLRPAKGAGGRRSGQYQSLLGAAWARTGSPLS